MSQFYYQMLGEAKSSEAFNSFQYDTKDTLFLPQSEECIGREQEKGKILRILNKKVNGNVIIYGQNGVGKTNIVLSLKKELKDIYNLNLIEVNAHFLFHFIQMKAQFDEKVISTLNTIVQNSNNVLFIDNFDIYMKDYRGQDFNFDMFFATFLDNNAPLKCIFTINEKNLSYIKGLYISKYFEFVEIKELKDKDLFEAVKYNVASLEKIYDIKISDEIIKKAIKYSERFIINDKNPKAALKILELTCSYKQASDKISNVDEKTLKEIKELEDKKQSLINEKNFIEAAEVGEKISQIKKSMYSNSSTNSIEEDDIKNVIADISGIPINKINVSNIAKLKNLENELNAIIVNQKDAISKVVTAIKRNSIGIRDINKPIGVFLFVGSTGTGKTYLAKQLADKFFISEKDIVRLDMSEYSDKIAVNKLFGTAPGYVGYDDGGVLTKAIQNNPYTIVLFDEIEKAHPTVFNALLQIFDDGHMTDNKGNTVSFKNTIIIMTSNVGCHTASKKSSINQVGFIKPNAEKDVKEMKLIEFKKIVNNEIKNKFSPEFINRIDDIILFNSLSIDDFIKIIELEIKKIVNRLKDNGIIKINVTVDKNLGKKIIEENKDSINLEYGAREVKRLLINFEDAISNFIINKAAEDANIKSLDISVDFQNGEYILK